MIGLVCQVSQVVYLHDHLSSIRVEITEQMVELVWRHVLNGSVYVWVLTAKIIVTRFIGFLNTLECISWRHEPILTAIGSLIYSDFLFGQRYELRIR